MQLPAGKPAELLQRLGGFEGEQKLAQLVGHRGRHRLGVSVLMEVPYAFVTKANKLHVIPSLFQYVLLCRTLQAVYCRRENPQNAARSLTYKSIAISRLDHWLLSLLTARIRYNSHHRPCGLLETITNWLRSRPAENPSHRREAGHSEETRDLSGDAPHAGHRHAGARDDEGRASDPAAREHQDHRRDLHAGSSGERALGHQLSDAGNFPPE
jgi:hypothetical protein